MGSGSRASVIVIGSRSSAHSSFLEAIDSGIDTRWVPSPELARHTLSKARFQDLIVFDTKVVSESQCAMCKQLRSQGQRVVCIRYDPDTVRECQSCTSGRDLLTAMLQAFVGGNGKA